MINNLISSVTIWHLTLVRSIMFWSLCLGYVMVNKWIVKLLYIFTTHTCIEMFLFYWSFSSIRSCKFGEHFFLLASPMLNTSTLRSLDLLKLRWNEDVFSSHIFIYEPSIHIQVAWSWNMLMKMNLIPLNIKDDMKYPRSLECTGSNRVMHICPWRGLKQWVWSLCEKVFY